MKIDKKSIAQKESISVAFFYNNTKKLFNMKLLTPAEIGMTKQINEPNLHRPGLALAGFVDLFTYNRIQLIGNTESQYCDKLSKEKRLSTLQQLLTFDIPCFVITNGNQPCQELIDLAIERDIAVLQMASNSTKSAYLISDFLEDQFSKRITIHGSFVDVYGVGILIVGKSGIGKSEVALDLVERGHRLVADDIVIFTKKGENILIGAGTDVIQHSMEIRGIGILDVERMFGVRSIRFQKRLEVVIELEVWDEKEVYTRTGLDKMEVTIDDVKILYVRLPIFPGKNITVIAETIAMNYLLKHYGFDAAQELQNRLQNKIRDKHQESERIVNYFEHDFE